MKKPNKQTKKFHIISAINHLVLFLSSTITAKKNTYFIGMAKMLQNTVTCNILEHYNFFVVNSKTNHQKIFEYPIFSLDWI